jgi:hypothetical protein
LSAPDELRHGDLAAFEPSSRAVEFDALTDTEFVLGSAAPHEHDLVLGYYSVHTSPDALRDAEAYISSIKKAGREITGPEIQRAVYPPSMVISVPVMNDDSSLARNTAR